MSETSGTHEHPKVEIAVKNFGPIAEANIDLRPLTVFVGPSNTGKTYFATLVYALHSAFNGLLGPDLLSHSEPAKIASLLSELLTDPAIPKEEIQDIHKKLSMLDRSFKLSDLPKRVLERFLTIIKDTDFFKAALQNELKNCFDSNSISELNRLTTEQRNEMTMLLKIGEGNQEYWNITMKVSGSEVNLDLGSSTNDNLVLIPQEQSVYVELPVLEGKPNITILRLAGSRYYLPAARSGIMQSHRIIAGSVVKHATRTGLERSAEIPTMSGVMADFIEKIILYEEKKGPRIEMKHLAETLETEVLAGQIRLKPSSSGYLDFRYFPQGIEEEIRLSQTSSMVSELAPLVLFLRGLINPGDTLIIEEPEAHLHPGAQADMAVILARLVRAGVRVIITTHSDWLLQEIGNLIREGELETTAEEVSDQSASLQKEQVGVWHFQKEGKVEEIPYNHIDGVEPMEYLDVAEDLYNRSARLQNQLEEVKGNSKRECE